MGIKHITTWTAAMLCAALAACGGGGSGGTPPVTYDLTVSRAGNGSGTVTGGGIDCGEKCSAAVDDGTYVTLTAASGTGSSFGGWGGACSGSSTTCTVNMSAVQAVTATFFGPRLVLNTEGLGGGTVAASVDGMPCGIGCKAYESGALVTLTAAASPDSKFTGWTRDCAAAGSAETCALTMSAAKQVTATFAFSGPLSRPDGSQYCYLPSEFAWTSSQPLAAPQTGYASLKDFSYVPYTDQDQKEHHLVYMSDVFTSTKQYGSAFMVFDDWSKMAGSTPTQMKAKAVAPTLFYFQPKKIWVLAYQWGKTSFSYKTSADPTKDERWSTEQALYAGTLPDAKPIDQTVICDAKNCFLFFAGDNGNIYRSSLPIDSFPGTFPKATTILSETRRDDLFEAVQVYTVEGTNQYLMLVECMGAKGRYFRAFSAIGLDNEWTPLTTGEAKPFAGKSNVTFPDGAWTDSISHGDLVRKNPDQTFTVNACDMQLLYQGYKIGSSTDPYDLIPWQPGLLQLKAREAAVAPASP